MLCYFWTTSCVYVFVFNVIDVTLIWILISEASNILVSFYHKIPKSKQSTLRRPGQTSRFSRFVFFFCSRIAHVLLGSVLIWHEWSSRFLKVSARLAMDYQLVSLFHASISNKYNLTILVFFFDTTVRMLTLWICSKTINDSSLQVSTCLISYFAF